MGNGFPEDNIRWRPQKHDHRVSGPNTKLLTSGGIDENERLQIGENEELGEAHGVADSHCFSIEWWQYWSA